MGYPELPPDGDENNFTGREITENFNPPTSEDSDNNEANPVEASPYSGYQQLTFDGENYSSVPDVNGEQEEEDDDDNEEEDGTNTPPAVIPTTYPADFSEIECAGGGNGFPDVTPVDLEIAQQVWSAPPEPNRANTIELDDTRTNQIMTLMSGISLPQNCIPEWAQNLSEDKWKQELLDKIRRGEDKKPSGV